MGWIRKRGKIFHIGYRLGNRHIGESSHSEDRRDAVALLDQRLKENKLRRTLVRDYKSPGVYFLYAGPEQLLKIGSSSNIERRVREQRLASPMRLILHDVIRTPHFLKLERALHALLKDRRKNGEWFEFKSGDLTMISDLCSALNTEVTDKKEIT